MSAQVSPILVAVTLIVEMFAASCAVPADAQIASTVNVSELKNIGGAAAHLCVVSPSLVRGAQPTAEGIARLKHAGVKTIIDLRNEPVMIEREAKVCRQFGVKLISIPLDEFNEPSAQDADRFLSAVNDPDNQPVYVHCLHGEDRTGAMVGLYRVNNQGWTADQAYQEMLARGFHPVYANLAAIVFDSAASLGRPGAGRGAQAGLMVDALRERLGSFSKLLKR